MAYIKKGKKYKSTEEQLNQIKSFFEEEVSPEEKYFVEYSSDIAVEVDNELKNKGLTQKEFAKLLGKRESEISKWLSGLHNLTIRSIAKMSAVLDKKLILTVSDAEKKYQKPTHIISLYAYKQTNRPMLQYENQSVVKKQIHIEKAI